MKKPDKKFSKIAFKFYKRNFHFFSGKIFRPFIKLRFPLFAAAVFTLRFFALNFKKFIKFI